MTQYIKTYHSIAARAAILLLAMLVMGNERARAQDPYEGTWYIKNNNTEYYLVPTINVFYNNDEDLPHLTTYQTAGDKNSIWRIEKVTDGYRIIHNATGKYIVANSAVGMTGANAHRKRVHLESLTELGDNTVFEIGANDDYVYISPAYAKWTSKNNGDNGDFKYFNPKSGNKAYYRADGGRGLEYADGIVGYWSAKGGDSNWKLVAATPTCANPVIKYTDDTHIQISYPIASDAGWTIYYTTDGSDPSSSSSRTAITSATTISATGISKVRAIATMSGYDSSEESVLVASGALQLIKSADTDAPFYMIPPVVAGEEAATTTNIPSASIAWRFEPAGLYGGIQYYNIINNSTGEYLYCSVGIGANNALTMKAVGDISSVEEIDRAKFRLILSGDGSSYKLVSKWWAAEATTSNIYVTKKSGNDKTDNINLTNGSDSKSLWTITPAPADKRSLSTVPKASTTSAATYVNLQQASSTSYYVVPPATAGGNATASNSETNRNWYLTPADDADEWGTYYHIRNGLTGEYLYFNGVAGTDNTFFTSTDVDSDNPDRYKFIVVRSANTTYPGSYNIIPKALKSEANQSNNSLNRNGTTLRTQNSRNAAGSLWNIVDGDYTIAVPYVTYDVTHNRITIFCSTPGATVYYTTDGTEPTTSSTLQLTTFPYTFTLTSGISAIRAIADKEGLGTSAETSCNIIVQTSTSDNESDKRVYLIQNQSNPWDDAGKRDYYMIPGDDGSESGGVNTTSLFRPTMEWYFKLAGIENGTPYYYIINHNNQKYLYYDATQDDGKRIWLKGQPEFDEADNGFKFRFQQYPTTGTPTGYNIIPYGLTTGKMYLHKGSGNNSSEVVTMNNSNNSDNSLWKFIWKADVDMTTPPFTVSTSGSVAYYDIENIGNPGYYIVPSADATAKVSVSNSTDAAVVGSRNWYFERAQDPTSSDWLTYYYIRSGVTGDYLYFDGTNFGMRGSNDGADAYLFTWAKAAKASLSDSDSYFIVPKPLKDTSLNNIYSINQVSKTELTLNANASRNAGGSKWHFVKSDMKVAPPVITYDASTNKVVITCTTPGVSIYYTTGATEAAEPTSSSTAYSGTGFDLLDDVNVIRAIAVKDGDSAEGTQLTIPVHASTSDKRLPYLVQSKEHDHYYMIPGEPAGGYDKLTTTSLARPSMMWCFEYASTDADGKQYFYIKNETTGQYVYYHDTDKMSLQSSSTFAGAADKEPYQFSIDVADDGGYTIRPKTDQTRWLTKSGGNLTDEDLTAATTAQSNGNARWAFVPVFDRKMPATTAPVTASTDVLTTYYMIRHEHDQDYYITIPASSGAAVSTTSTATMDIAWRFLEAGHDDWLTYYNIQNAVTGEYLYLVAAGANAFAMGSSPDGNEAYQFALAKSTTDGVYIVPKSLKYNGTKTYYSIFRDGDAPLKTDGRRYSGSGGGDDTYIKWTLLAPSHINCDPPVITYDAEADGYVITTPIAGSKAYYAINDLPVIDDAHEYSAPIAMSSLNEGDVIRAIAASNKDDVTKSIETSVTIQKVATPVITADNNTGTVVITCETDGATIYYTTDDSDPATSETRAAYSEPLQNISGKNVKAIAVKGGLVASDQAVSGTITLTCADPVIARTGAAEVTITCAIPTAGVTIYYTLDGTDPTTSSSHIASGGTIDLTGKVPTTVKAMATAKEAGFEDSGIVEKVVKEGLSGSGTDADPYLIASSTEFDMFVTMVNGDGTVADYAGCASKWYKVEADITVSSNTAVSVPFTGTFDGGLFTLSGLSDAIFNTVDGGTVRNVIMDGVSISGGTNVGAIANEATGAARIYNCGVLGGSVGGTGSVGSIVGLLDGTARVINCYSYATVSGGTDVGGIVGNNNGTTKAGSINTMVMNCMFYGDITSGTNISPVYGGNIINNLTDNSNRSNDGLNNYNYYAYDKLTSAAINKYNCALAVEEKFLNRFEFYRLLLNSNKKLAAFYITGSANDADIVAKWVIETADRSISEPKPYPVLKRQGKYPSIINIDAEHAEQLFLENGKIQEADRNKGGKIGTLTVNISSAKTTGGQDWPAGASIHTSSLTLNRTDKDFNRFNFNYDKVQLPYYNDVGDGNCTGNRVVTGWKITGITSVSDDPYTSANYPATGITDYPNHNYADRKSSNKDLYSVSGRVFSQGAYFDVPYGVSSITIEPYWGKAAYLSDANYDVVYKNNYSSRQDVTQTGTQATTFHGQAVKTSVGDALTYISGTLGGFGSTVYDNAVVLVGNYHLDGVPSGGTNPFTMMSVDEDKDDEPDYSLIYHHKGRSVVCPIRYDFLNIPGTAQAQKPNGASLICNMTIYKTKGWFEITNTSLAYFSQYEYENQDGNTKADAPLILQGGVIDQFVSTQSSAVSGKTYYIHLGGNLWVHEVGFGTHSDGSQKTPHVPVSVTGGDFDGFYLTGTYNANAAVSTDNAECYISGGRFGEVAGAAQEQINGDVRWQIYDADITDFFGGGTNDAKPITGTVTTDIYNSHVKLFCGGPKFGNMTDDKDVRTTADGCTFGNFFGAGYGGNSYSRKKYYDKDGAQTWSTLQAYYTNDRGKYYDGKNTELKQGDTSYGNKGPGVATDFDYEFFVWSSGATGARFFVHFVSFSLAQCDDVYSTLKNCTVNENFYGGGSLGKVTGKATSRLEDCVVKGNAFGAGYSATLPPIEVRDGGFTKDPKYNSSSGMFEPGIYTGTTNYTWKQVGSYPSEGGAGFDGTQVITTQNLEHTNLGSVGEVDFTITGSSKIGTDGDATKGNVYGGGDESGVSGNTILTVTENAKVLGNVYGGGNIGSVGTFTFADAAYNATHTDVPIGKPYACADNTGKTTVTINGNAEIGPNGMKMTADNAARRPDDAGMVFGAGRGTVDPLYDDPVLRDKPITNDAKQAAISAMNEAGTLDAKLDELACLAYVNQSEVTIDGNAFVKGSVYGGSENGHVLGNTWVKIQGGQIGNGDGVNRPYTAEEWSREAYLQECSHWPYTGTHSPHDIFADKYDPELDTYDKFDNGAVSATDGHTFYGNVFGGGSGYYPYAPGKWLRSAGVVEGNTRVDITGGHILTSAYGGNEMTDVLGSCSVTMTGGTLGVPRSTNGMFSHPVTCYLFGAGKGDERTWANDWTNVGSTSVSVGGKARIFGSVFGGGEDGHVLGDAITTISAGDVVGTRRYPYIGTDGMSAVDGNIFGGGRGFAEVALTAGVVCGNVELTIKGGTMLGSVFGGGRLASVGTYLVPPEDANYGKMQPGDDHGHITIDISGGMIGALTAEGNLAPSAYTIGDVFTGCKGSALSHSRAPLLGQCKTTTLTISEANPDVPTVINRSAFGGGEAGNVQGNVTVNMLGGTVKSDIYGGGARADSNTSNWDADKDNGEGKEKGGWAEGKTSASATTIVNLLGGSVGDVYGGGLGLKEGIDGSSADLPAYVWGDTQVNLNGLAPSEYVAATHSEVVTPMDEDGDNTPDYYLAGDGCVVQGNIFGCNNLSGTPKGASTVHVYKTKGWTGHYRTGYGVDAEDGTVKALLEGDAMTAALNDIDDTHHSYEVAAVYGGGNLAAYEPVDEATATTHVIIDGCEQTSIKTVYGGGNAASTPATLVDIYGTYEIEEAFGGGNGKDDLPNGNKNPGANVGYKDYSKVEETFATKEDRQGDAFAAYRYGSGEAQMNIHGGKVHRVYGGSNTKGNVRISAVTMLEEESGCPFDVDEAYGGGKSAPMDGATDLQMACIPGLKTAFGGAEDANVEGNVTLNITNGYFDRVFGGNNIAGTIGGTITVNVEETGCKPIVIGQLYGGGNLAPYTAPADEHGPTLNVRSFSSIGEVYGGGYGETAIVTGDTYVNINVCDGMDYSDNETLTTRVAAEIENRKHISFWDYVIENGKIKTDDDGNRVEVEKTVDIAMPTRTGLMGAIHNVFGGGNAAEVRGNTNVSIGTASSEVFATPKTKTVEGVEVQMTEAERTKTVRGADIKGNVYGGGNNADVTGNTNVTVGK